MITQGVLTQLNGFKAQILEMSHQVKAVSLTSSPEGKAMLDSDVKKVHLENEKLAADAAELRSKLEEAVNMWGEFHRVETEIINFISTTEVQLKQIHLKSTLKEKQTQSAEILVRL